MKKNFLSALLADKKIEEAQKAQIEFAKANNITLR